MNQAVVIKSSKNGIQLKLNPDLSFEELKEEIATKFIESEKFFKNASVALSFDGRDLSEEEQLEILHVIESSSTVHIVCIMDEDELRDEVIKRRMNEYVESHSVENGLFYKGTLRSGQQVESQSSLVVLGDVNPGAKVMAKGNIVVLGSLKGIAYAGVGGDSSCFVTALEMDPVQIKIGDYIGRSADKKTTAKFLKKRTKEDPVPQIASVFDGQILIEPITKGVLKEL